MSCSPYAATRELYGCRLYPLQVPELLVSSEGDGVLIITSFTLPELLVREDPSTCKPVDFPTWFHSSSLRLAPFLDPFNNAVWPLNIHTDSAWLESDMYIILTSGVIRVFFVV